jgi:hypothetical protein
LIISFRYYSVPNFVNQEAVLIRVSHPHCTIARDRALKRKKQERRGRKERRRQTGEEEREIE